MLMHLSLTIILYNNEPQTVQVLFSLVKLVPNMLYFCYYNKCHLQLKHIVGKFARSSVDTSGKFSRSIESALQRHDKSLVHRKMYRRSWHKSKKSYIKSFRPRRRVRFNFKVTSGFFCFKHENYSIHSSYMYYHC